MAAVLDPRHTAAATLAGVAAPDAGSAPAGVGPGAGLALSAHQAEVTAYLRGLWKLAPALLPLPGRLQLASTADAQGPEPMLSPLGIHLPMVLGASSPAQARRWYLAAAAHAAAHRVYSTQTFDPKGLPPITRALLGLLEDARIEWLACRELPGLRRLWLPWHQAENPAVEDGQHSAMPGTPPGFDSLLRRLAHALLDPQHPDDHPWVVKGRQLFFADHQAGAAAQVLALRQPDELRRAAMRLGHDIGQMRLPFNARGHRVGPSYRDNNQCLWPPTTAPAANDPLPLDTGQDGAHRPDPASRQALPSAQAAEADPTRPSGEPRRYPEWDRLIQRHRPDWCTVWEQPAGLLPDAPTTHGRAGSVADNTTAPADTTPPAWLARQLRLAHLQPAAPSLAHDGELLDLPSLVQYGIADRLGRPHGDPVHRRHQRRPVSASVLLLLDVSASTTARFGHGPDGRGGPEGAGHSLLTATRHTAALLVQALQAAGARTAVQAFRSNGRAAVCCEVVKTFDQAFDSGCRQRLDQLHSGWSTRLGAALRHATATLAAEPAALRQVLLVSDAELHDVDIHDPRYLAEDARQAVAAARRHGVQVRCLLLQPGAPQDTTVPLRIFGAGACRVMRQMDQLPHLAAQLLGG